MMALAVLDLFYFIFNILTLITDVSTLDGGLCTCAAAAMLAMVLRWFIWLIAIVTDAGGRLTGINGWGIIIKGSSSPGGEKINENRITSFLSLSLSIYFFIYIYKYIVFFSVFSSWTILNLWMTRWVPYQDKAAMHLFFSGMCTCKSLANMEGF